MKRVIALLLAMILFTGILPIDAAATEQEFVNVQLILDGKPRQYKVIESGSELMFSGEDLAAMGGYEYRIEQGSAYFTRGMKTLRVDLEASRLYPFEDIALISKINMAEKVREVDSVYYFPGTEMLPWLNVDCFVLEGQLNICKDEVSIWEIIPVFAPEEFEFDFTACCKELGVNGKYLKARAYLQDEGLTGMFFDIIPVVGDSLDYYDLFEDIVQDQSAADEEIDEMLEDAEDVSYWMEIAEDFEVIEDLPDELRLFGEVANFLSNNAVSFSFEMASYVKNFYQNHENILAAFHSMIVNSGVYKHQLPMTAISALMEVEESYTDYYAGIEYKMMKTIGETAFEGLASVPSGLFDAATTLVGFAEATSPDWAEGINRISSYDMIAEYCVRTYEELTDHTWTSSIEDMCGLAYMYLYSCEQNWAAMADYALKEGNLDLAAKYRAVAESTEEWQRKFMEAVSAAINDSHEYEVVDGSMKQGYTDKLKAMFDQIPRNQSGEMLLSQIHAYSGDGGTLYSLEYDDNGRITQIIENNYGEYFLDSEIDPMRLVYSYSYDDFGKLTHIDGDNECTSTQFVYNEKGLLSKSIATYFVSVTTEYFYDESARLIAEESHADIEDTRIEYTYDEKGALSQVDVLWEQCVDDTYVSGQPISEDSLAAYYYLCMTEQKQHYGPLEISDVEERASLVDSVGNEILTLYLSNPQYVVDSMGNLVQISCDNETYEFYYMDHTNDTSSSMNYVDDFIKLDYAILLGALCDAGLTNIQWELAEMEFDGIQELLVTASGGDWRASWENYPLLADVDQRLIWYYDPGPAGSAEWAFMNSAGKPVLNDSYSTAWCGVWHSEWTGSSWNVFAEYERSPEYNTNGEYVPIEECTWYGTTVSPEEYSQHLNNAGITNMTLGSPDLAKIVITGDPEQIVAELEEYLSTSGYLWGREHQQSNRIIYLIPGAANNWKTEPSDIAEELCLSNFDCALTLITAYISEESISLVLSRTYSYEE